MTPTKPKILIVFEHRETDNQFVFILAEGIARQGMDVTCSTEKFWNDDDTHYDIVHFQWPEELVGWSTPDPAQIDRLRRRIDVLRTRGTRFVYTRHNSHPHNANGVLSTAYGIVEACSDAVVHMGRYSQDEYQATYPGTLNYVIPHHIYQGMFREDLTREEARRYLGIPQRKFVITAFGKFRNNAEIRLILKGYFKAKLRRKCLLAPRLFPFSRTPLQSSTLKRFVSRLGYYTVLPLARLWGIRGGASDELVTDHDLPYYIAASDVLFIQRKRILNSGNVPLGFLFHKIVIGPDSGNVGEWLRDTGNPVFDPDSAQSIADAIGRTFALRKADQGEKNYRYALEYMNLERVASLYVDMYNEVLSL